MIRLLPRPARALLPSACLVAALAAAAGAQSFDRYIPADSIRAVVLRVDEAQVVCGPNDLDEVHVAVSGTMKGRSLGPLDPAMEQHRSADTLFLTLRLRGPGDLPSVNPTARLDVSVPADTWVWVRVANGGVNLEDLGAGARLETVDDRIRVVRLEGPLTMITRDGVAWARDVNGPLRAVARDGQVDVAGILPSVDARAENGSLDIKAVKGSQSAEGFGSRDWVLSTAGGSVRLDLPGDFPCLLAVRTRTGNLDAGPFAEAPQASAADTTALSWPRLGPAGAPGAGHGLAVRPAPGRARILVETVSGDITLR